ncbi:xanthine dehydrogenase accessory factor [Kaistia soli DSM 19436]|uniref:Xanthine dehydrogenase accessory factor n=1 Tax=Kaistia soli DSM 19436 TaxID=1122133 RepID=A0A1M5FHR6_9HYPH|nr:xanthine dehydrogenase accessory protein XdhC [Kaistia soli]SHF91045.1 xanthine dehydrogenase accessory factor [Kaistia soli DSM 19436]
MLVWQRLLDAIDRHGRAAMASLVETRGSAPREAGARLLVMPDGGFSGTIGGGTLEWRAIAEAQRLLAREPASGLQISSIALGPELGQCCGGRVELALEIFGSERRDEVGRLAELEAAGPFRTRATLSKTSDRLTRQVVEDGSVEIGGARIDHGTLEEGFGEERRALFLFGSGHVGRALVLALAPLPFAVTWIDPRPDAFPALVPANCRCVQQSDAPEALSAAPDGAFVLIMTHSHALDLAIVHKALADERFAYVGLIGSASKRARFSRLLGEAGVGAAGIARMACPIGIPGIRSKLPAVIAASVASDLLIRDEAARGAIPIEADPHRQASLRSPRGS